MTNLTTSPTARRILFAVVLLLALAGLFALDLAGRGLAWRALWSVTGEESVVGQVRGGVEWLGSLIRPHPHTEPITVIAHTGMNPYGINTFLEQEVELAKREQQVRMIADAGFGWLRQEFPWQDIEIAARGDFIDRRNVEAVGEISAWDKYDHIVGLAEQYGLRLQVRLSNPPQWAQAGPDAGDFAPPVDPQDFVNYAVAVAERYRGRIRYYQVWNEPNIYPEWGEQAVDPEAYTDLLCRTYDALKAVDPEIVVINGALAPTVSLSGRDLSDFIYLQRMYDAGAARCFDIHSMQGYGLNSGPTDRRMRPTTVNFSRNLYIREIMVANGDAHKPIWISEAAWSPVAEPGVPADLIGFGTYGRTTLEQAARYMPIAYQRARQEWPWVGVMNYWFFKHADDSRKDQAWYYFRMVEPDFTPLPVYAAMRDYIAQATPVLYLGIHQEDHRAISLYHGAEIRTVETAELRQAAATYGVTFTAHGTDIRLRWFGHRDLAVRIDEGLVYPNLSAARSGPDGWYEATIHHSLLPETRAVQVSAFEPFLLDSVTVFDRTRSNLTPLITGGAGLLLLVVGVVISALRVRRS